MISFLKEGSLKTCNSDLAIQLLHKLSYLAGVTLLMFKRPACAFSLSSHFIGEKRLRKVAGSNSIIHLGRIQKSHSGIILSLNTFVMIILKVEFVVTFIGMF